MRRRLDLASALIHRPQVLFLDEPTTGLDPVSRKAIWEEVGKLNADGTTVFLTTQYLEEADQLADRVGIISGGKLVAEGTPTALKSEVGKPHLELSLVEQAGKESRAEEVLARFGTPLPARDGTLMVELEHGTSEVGPIVVALNQAGLDVESLDLVQPTLDDVFVHKTGQHLEGASEETGESEAIVE
jgi:ABC-2 type transport system ATP-binding protein